MCALKQGGIGPAATVQWTCLSLHCPQPNAQRIPSRPGRALGSDRAAPAAPMPESFPHTTPLTIPFPALRLAGQTAVARGRQCRLTLE